MFSFVQSKVNMVVSLFKTQEPFPLLDLPQEVVLLIIARLEYKDQVKIGRVSRLLRQLSQTW
jgi:hypothetical protein